MAICWFILVLGLVMVVVVMVVLMLAEGDVGLSDVVGIVIVTAMTGHGGETDDMVVITVMAMIMAMRQ